MQVDETKDLSLTRLQNGVVRVRLNRAPVNALNTDFLTAFGARIDALSEDGDVRAILIDSPFKAFSAGMDLKESMALDTDGQVAVNDAFNVAMRALYRSPKPTVTAINGPAIAGGFFFVLASDCRVAGPNAQFGLAEIRVGADFPVATMDIARAELDPNDLRRFMLTGRPIDAATAAARGIVDHLVAAEEVAARAEAEAQALAALPPQTYAAIKSQIRGPVLTVLDANVQAEAARPERRWFRDETKAAMAKMLA